MADEVVIEDQGGGDKRKKNEKGRLRWIDYWKRSRSWEVWKWS